MLDRRLFLAGVSATAAARAVQAAEVDTDDGIRGLLQRRIDVQKRTVGMAVTVVGQGRQRIVSWGRERVAGDRLVGPDTVFEIGSVTKVFTALLLADLVNRGRMHLDDPVANHLPGDFRVPQVEGRQITLADLATHTSGLPRFPPFPGIPLSPPFIEAMLRFTADDFKAWLAEVRPQRAPGGWEYSNAVGFTLLGMALAHRGGAPFDRLLQSRILDRLGLHDTVFQPTSAMTHRVAESHDPDLNPVPALELGIFSPAGGLRSTPADMARFTAAILPGASSPIAVDQRLLLTVRRPAPPIGGMQALGWEVLDAPGGSFISKDGVASGQAASMVLDPDKRIAIVVFSNTLPDLRASAPSGGGVGAADLARHLLRPQLALGA